MAVISGPTTIGTGCAGNARPLVLDATQSHALTGGRGVSGFAWAVSGASSAALTQYTEAATAAGSAVLTIPSSAVVALPVGPGSGRVVWQRVAWGSLDIPGRPASSVLPWASELPCTPAPLRDNALAH